MSGALQSAGYRVRLDAFEGPLDLLLHLVKTNEVDIYHLPIAVITDQYLEYLGMFQELDLDIAGEYLVMAATLMYLKSRLLLPMDEEDPGDDEEGDPAADLVRQLAEYRRYREVADELRDRVMLGRDVFRREPTAPDPLEGEEPEYRTADLGGLLEALRRVLRTAAGRRPHDIAGEDYRVADCARILVDKLRAGGRVEFAELFRDNQSRAFIIATFVGLLEMIKLGVVDVEQSRICGDLYLSLALEHVDDAISVLAETYEARGPLVLAASEKGASDVGS
jgi:segregation and condensation protein A